MACKGLNVCQEGIRGAEDMQKRSHVMLIKVMRVMETMLDEDRGDPSGV